MIDSSSLDSRPKTKFSQNTKKRSDFSKKSPKLHENVQNLTENDYFTKGEFYQSGFFTNSLLFGGNKGKSILIGKIDWKDKIAFKIFGSELE